MRMSAYNGWTNYETWLLVLWLDNDQNMYDFWVEQGKKAEEPYHLAQEMKDDFYGQLGGCRGVTGFLADLLNAALQEVNWQEVAREFYNVGHERGENRW